MNKTIYKSTIKT